MPDTKSSTEPTADENNENPTDESEQVASEYGGPKGREPPRYGDWEKNGRCIDF